MYITNHALLSTKNVKKFYILGALLPFVHEDADNWQPFTQILKI